MSANRTPTHAILLGQSYLKKRKKGKCGNSERQVQMKTCESNLQKRETTCTQTETQMPKSQHFPIKRHWVRTFTDSRNISQSKWGETPSRNYSPPKHPQTRPPWRGASKGTTRGGPPQTKQTFSARCCLLDVPVLYCWGREGGANPPLYPR